MTWSLRRWWTDLWRARPRPVTSDPVPDEPGGPRGASGGLEDDPVRRAPTRRRYTASLPDDDPRREAHLGAVLQALSAGPLSRDELGRAVGAADWGTGRLDAVVEHGITTGVLLGDDATVRARYTD